MTWPTWRGISQTSRTVSKFGSRQTLRADYPKLATSASTVGATRIRYGTVGNIDKVLEWAAEKGFEDGIDPDLVAAAKSEFDWLSYKSMLDETIRNRVSEFMN